MYIEKSSESDARVQIDTCIPLYMWIYMYVHVYSDAKFPQISPTNP